jgi:glycerophosphoryl diester phosphodiesterase
MRWSLSKPVRPRRPDWLTARPFAHRGLHSAGIPENSRAAFEAAIAAGNGIELDVQPCRGGAAIVFHDARFERLCEARGRIDRLKPEEVATIRLKGSAETLPSLDEALEVIGGRTALLVEIKAPDLGWRALCRSVATSLADYPGPVAVMSFRTAAISWFARHAPLIVRGLVMSDEGKQKRPLLRGLALRAADPDFLAYDIRSLPSPFTRRAREKGLAILSWTVRSREDLNNAKRHADQIIHELPAGEAQ